MSINNILPLLKKVKQTGQGRWLACCPVHPDKSPSLVITDISGKVLIHCFGCGCGIDEFCQALEISTDELFPEKMDIDYREKRKREYFNAGDILKALHTEIIVINLCIHELKNGKTLHEKDVERLELAENRLSTAINYIN